MLGVFSAVSADRAILQLRITRVQSRPDYGSLIALKKSN